MRLIEQLSYSSPTDAYQAAFDPHSSLKDAAVGNVHDDAFPWNALTLVLPCRSVKRGELSKAKLLKFAELTLRKAQRQPNYDGNAERFLKNLVIDILYCDLAVMKSVLEFAEELWLR